MTKHVTIAMLTPDRTQERVLRLSLLIKVVPELLKSWRALGSYVLASRITLVWVITIVTSEGTSWIAEKVSFIKRVAPAGILFSSIFPLAGVHALIVTAPGVAAINGDYARYFCITVLVPNLITLNVHE